MPYTAEISRTNPTALIFLLDQSNSMSEPFGGQLNKSKADGVADAVNRLLQNVALKCTKADGIRDFFYVGIISYGGDVSSAFGGVLAGLSLVPISRIADNPLRVEERTRKVASGAVGFTEQKFKFPVWIEPRPTGRTPMCAALRQGKEYVEAFLGMEPDCYPPIVINITDGQPTDGDPHESARDLCALASTDGNALLFNAHISDKPSRPVEFPQDEANLPDDFSKLLFRMSSVLPPKLVAAAQAEGLAVGTQSRGFAFNADLVATIRFLDIGTRVTQNVR